ncbi:unnamed protein product [[Candida] boidinii]|nr:unnamed protein product [[Candida] boidinii]
MISTDNSDSIKSTQALKFKKLNITKGNPLPQMPPISIINNSIKNDYINETTRDINIKFKDDINNAVITDSQSIRPTIDDTIYSSFSSLSTLKSSSESPDVSPFATPISDAVTDTNTSSSLDQSSYAFVSSLDHFPCDIVRSLWLIQSLNLKIANLQDQLNIELNNLNNDNTSKLNPENYLCIKEKLLKFSNEAISESKYLINKINFHGSIVGHNINLMNNLKNIRLKLLRERNWSNFNNFKKDYLKKLPPYQIKEIENSIGILENESEPYFPDFFNKKELSSYNLKVKNHFNRNQNDDSNNNSSLITAKQGLSTIQNSNFGLMKDSTTQENRIQEQKIKEESPSNEFTVSKEIIEDPNPTETTDRFIKD